jgi:hypothetical protein
MLNKIIRTVTLGKKDFKSLYRQLKSPKQGLEPPDVLRKKSEFLGLKEDVTHENSRTNSLTGDSGDGDGDGDGDDDNDDGGDDDNDDGDGDGDDSLSSEMSELPSGTFPCTIQYLDLNILSLKNLPRVPTLMLIRSDWKHMMDRVCNRQKSIEGTIVVTGQPGIGLCNFF